MPLLDSNYPVNGWRGLGSVGRAFGAVWEPSWTAFTTAYGRGRGMAGSPFGTVLKEMASAGWGAWTGSLRGLGRAALANLDQLFGQGVPWQSRALAAARLGAAALGAYAPVATAYRLLRGGGLLQDEYGRPDLAFLPFF